jgi:hypothetical protein
MKTVLLIALAAVTLSTMSAQTAAAPRHTATKVVKPISIPKGAVKTDDGYRAVDSKGKVWIYRETPFGITKAEYKAPAPAIATDPAKDTRVSAKGVGDSVEFERTGPFGVSHWQKKKSELTPDEQAIWDRFKK